MGSAFLCADLGVTPEVRDYHAQCLGHWLSVLKSESRAIFTAATHAQRAADHLHGLQPTPDPQPPDPARRRVPATGLPPPAP